MRHEIGTAIIRIRKAGLHGFADEHDNDAGVLIMMMTMTTMTMTLMIITENFRK